MNRSGKPPIKPFGPFLTALGTTLLYFLAAAGSLNAQCPPGTACDPGPRPVGTQSALFAGPVNAATGLPLLPTPIVNTRQPADLLGNEGAGHAIANSGQAGKFWGDSVAVFGQLVSVNGATDPASNNPTLLGLGPAFNGNSCFMCHSQPAIGGTSPGTGTPGFTQNPQLTVAHAFNATNAENLSPIITPNGPIREARFIVSETDPSRQTLDGGVHDLFSIQGRTDAPPGCQLLQPDVSTQFVNRNAIFRIPTPTFGLGLIENVANADLIANAVLEHGLGFNVQNAVMNVNGNDGSVTRFGWKAQNKSLYLFAGEAANVELGMSNELFPNERTPGNGCAGNPQSEDNTRVTFPTGLNPQDVDSFVSSSIENFAMFMRLNGAPAQCDYASGVDVNGNALCNSLSASATAGQTVFSQIGCNACHTVSFTTQPSAVPGLSNRVFHPYSDFGLHHMGATLADGVTQGLAGPDQFRTAPLWGVGQRLFFLHDGRTSDLKEAILAHYSNPLLCYTASAGENFFVTFPQGNGPVVAATDASAAFNNAIQGFSTGSNSLSCGSEANTVVGNFSNLNATSQQNLLDFLRSL